MPQPSTSQPFQPTTFLERGVHVSFTSPSLAGARVRGTARAGLEVLLPNPSGGRGLYVAAWADVRAMVRPTVHDMQLMELVAAMQTITPATIRNAARQVASEGLAGRAAGVAAVASLASDKESLALTKHQLRRRLVLQEEPSGSANLQTRDESASAFERRVMGVVMNAAPRLGQKPVEMVAHLAELAPLYDPIGLDSRAGLARIPQTVAKLRRLRHQAASLPVGAGGLAPALIKILVGTADLTLTGVDQALADARALAEHMTDLLDAWHAQSTALAHRLDRADWMMDGWERICQLWQLDPQPAFRSDTLDQLAILLPSIPREMAEWVGSDVDTGPLAQLRTTVLGREDWRTGQSVLDVIARNEAMLAS